ncbi:MAG TPA: fatty acid desaturase [Methylomirabilota bacterium]|jgi:fatty acid desaturase
MSERRLWRHTWRDARLVAASAIQLAFNVWLAATWDRRGWTELLWLWLAGAVLFWYNAVVVTHNFLHTPWFEREPLNRIYAAMDSVSLGVPVTLCRFHHLNHHRYGNDPPDALGRTQDHSSTYRFGRDGRPARALSYALLGLFRGGTAEAWRAAVHGRERGRLLVELAAVGIGIAGYLALCWQFVLLFLIPVFYAGSVLGILTNYYQHGGGPGRSWPNAVSHYGRLYNWLCCNEGYHREHHRRPGVHWTERPALREARP